MEALLYLLMFAALGVAGRWLMGRLDGFLTSSVYHSAWDAEEEMHADVVAPSPKDQREAPRRCVIFTSARHYY